MHRILCIYEKYLSWRWNDSNINYCQRKKKRGRCGRKMNAKIKFFRIWRYIRCRELRTKQKESAICTFTFFSYLLFVQHLPRFVLCFSNWSAREATGKTQTFFFFFFNKAASSSALNPNNFTQRESFSYFTRFKGIVSSFIFDNSY